MDKKSLDQLKRREFKAGFNCAKRVILHEVIELFLNANDPISGLLAEQAIHSVKISKIKVKK